MLTSFSVGGLVPHKVVAHIALPYLLLFVLERLLLFFVSVLLNILPYPLRI